jgi:beta-N-acetylhexosaminidase
MGIGAAILGCEGAVLQAKEADFFRDYNPFGFILFARNIDTPAQVQRLTADLRACLGRDAPILIDQEGGRVQRLRPPHWRDWPPPLDMLNALPSQDQRLDAMILRTQLISAELRAVGIDANCAPVADIATDDTHPFLRNRCYGTNAAQVADLALAVAQTHLACGVLPVAKHLPGHGRANADTHLHLPRVSAPLEELIATDFAPFAALRHCPMAMTAHIIFDALDPDHPATQSAAAIAAIRQIIGFDGLLMTDDLNMQALSGDLATRTQAAMAAGCDIALHCNGDLAQMQAVAGRAGCLTEQAQRRAAAALAQRAAPNNVDIAALEAAFSTLMQGKGQAHGNYG